MLTTLRKSANHIVTKIFLGLLVLTFILWGVGDMLRGTKDDIAFKVGDIEYTKTEWARFYKSQFERLGDDYKQFYDINSGELKELFLTQLVNSALLKEEARRLGVSVGDDAVKYEIINNMPGLMRDGKFDKTLLANFLQNANISESFFIEKIREELVQKLIIETISSANLLNNILLEQITEALHLKKEIEIYKPNIYFFDIKEQPTDDQLQVVLESNKSLFTVPEKRDVAFVKFHLEDAKTINEKISKEELEGFYKEHMYLFTLPEKRKFLKLIFANEEEAKSIYNDKLSKGEDFIVLSKALKQDPGFNSAPVNKDGFDSNVAETIFSLKQNEISKPILTPFGSVSYTHLTLPTKRIV